MWMVVVWGILGTIAGFGAFIWLLNRLLSFLKSSRLKAALILPMLLMTMVGFFWLALLSPQGLGRIVVLVTLAAMLLGERRRVVFHHVHWNPPSADSRIPNINLFHPITTTEVASLRYKITLPEMPDEGIRLVFLSDFHINRRLPISYFQSVVEEVNALSPQIVLLGGDFVSEGSHISLLSQFLGNLRASVGIYAVLGNHDYWCCAREVQRAVEDFGVRFIGGSWTRVTISAQQSVLLGGCEAPWGKTLSVDKHSPKGELRLVLAHSADRIYTFVRNQVPMVFTGHYHAGQVRLPAFGALVVPSRYGRRFLHGHYSIENTHLFVSSGIGAAMPPLRINCLPDFIAVDILRDAEPSRVDMTANPQKA